MPEKADTRQWFLKIAEDTIFGPVTTRSLILWAEQGRILPGHVVSEDRTSWKPAEDLPELGLEWFIEDSLNNLRGPLNKLAAEAFLAGGKAPEGARLVPAAEADLSRLRTLTDPIHAETERTLPLAAPKRDAAAAHDPAIAALKQENTALQQELETARKAQTKSQADHDARLATLQQELDTLRAAVPPPETADRIAALEQTCQAKERQIAAFIQTISGLKQQLESLRSASDPIPDETAANIRDALAQAEAQRDAALARLRDLEAEQATRQAAAPTPPDETAIQLRAALAEAENQRDAALSELKNLQAAPAPAPAVPDTETTAHLAQLEQDFAELLTASNERDLAAGTRISDLEAQLARPMAGPSPEFLQIYDLLIGEVQALQTTLDEERAWVARQRELNTARQEALQKRMQALCRLLGQDPDELRRNALRETNNTSSARFQAELGSIKANYQQELQKAAEREADLERRLRQFEAQDARMRAQVSESERQNRRTEQLLEDQRRTEQMLAQERKTRLADQEQFNAAQEALLRRIDELERGNPFLATEKKTEETKHPAFRPTPWMRFKK